MDALEIFLAATAVLLICIAFPSIGRAVLPAILFAALITFVIVFFWWILIAWAAVFGVAILIVVGIGIYEAVTP